jgi:NAD(P)-dependent dehydrogenase (short-subunit alcohol dehydrogenase family)
MNEQTRDSVEVALIAGGATGVGFEVARMLAERSASVAILDSDRSAVSEAVAVCRDSGVSALGFDGDASADRISAVVQKTATALGRITTVIGCLSHDVPGEIDVLDDDVWEKSLHTNVTGIFALAKHTMAQLMDGGGTFVAVTSTAGVRGVAGHAAYSAASHAVVGLVRSIALDYASRGVRSNVVCHGPITQHGDASSMRRVPAGRVGTATEVASFVAHLASARASYTNGGVHVVDGGLCAGYLELSDQV